MKLGASRAPLCRRCKQPYVAKHVVAGSNGDFKFRDACCPDCAVNMGPKRPVEMDCYQYIRPFRVGARLVDGFRMLRWAE